jgi:predicted MFS family arabinose efflux permease
LALSIFALAFPIGIAGGYLIGGVVGDRYGWRSALQVVGFPGTLLAVLVLFIREPVRGANDPGSVAKSPGWEDYKQLARNVPFLYVCAGMAAMTFMAGGLSAFATKFLTDVRGLPLEQASSTFGIVMAVAGFLGAILGGTLSEKVARGSTSGQLWFSGIGLLLAAPITAASILCPTPKGFFTFVFFGLVCIFLNAGPLNAAIANVVPANVRTAAYSLNILLIHLAGDIPSPIAIGYLADRSSLTVALTATSLVSALAGVILLIGARRVTRDVLPENLIAAS